MYKKQQYINLYNLRRDFQRAGTHNDSQFNAYDNPGLKYFKIFFHFYNGDTDDVTKPISSGGLLSPIFDVADLKTDEQLRQYTTAWTYLKLNGEDERADLLKDFIYLLSNISSYSPWYFQSIDGLDGAIERKMVSDKEFKLEDDNQKITIKCLKDAVDDRIGSLLDMYRSIVYSYGMKRYILPGNLRRFDMSIVVFDSPIITDRYRDSMLEDEKMSYKYYEFHNCEIDYASAKSGVGLNNAEGHQGEYSIDISFDDMYEDRYNEFIDKRFGDFVMLDFNSTSNADYSEGIGDLYTTKHPLGGDQELEETTNQTLLAGQTLDGYPGSSSEQRGLIGNAASQVIGAASKELKGALTSAVLGNLHTLSVTDVATRVDNALKGDVLGTYNAVQRAVNNEEVRTQGNASVSGALENMFEHTKDKITERVETLGNLYKINSVKNNL